MSCTTGPCLGEQGFPTQQYPASSYVTWSSWVWRGVIHWVRNRSINADVFDVLHRWIVAIKASIKKWLPLHQALQDYMNQPPEETRMWDTVDATILTALDNHLVRVYCYFMLWRIISHVMEPSVHISKVNWFYKCKSKWNRNKNTSLYHFSFP